MATELTQFMNNLGVGQFQARPVYDPDGDFVTFFISNNDAYAERVDELLTVYHSADTNQLVGCKIKGVRSILEALGSFGVHLNDCDRITLGLLFVGGAVVSNNPRVHQYYRELAAASSSNDGELELDLTFAECHAGR